MKTRILRLAPWLMSITLMSIFSFANEPHLPKTIEFSGAVPSPVGLTDEAISQLQVQFPNNIDQTSSAAKNPFQVACSPEVKGFSSWANNESIWTYNFKPKDENSVNRLAGGSHCVITQVSELKSTTGQVWPVGTINYTVTINGPKVTEVLAAHGFKDMLREKEPLMLILFDGPVKKESLFENQTSYLNYVSANAPSEKIPLVSVPDDQIEKIFNEFKSQRYFETEYKEKNWVLATVKQNLIPGATVALNISNQVSAANPNVNFTDKFTREYAVRSQFQAEIVCQRPSAKEGVCLPESPITVALNGRVKWTDIRKAYLEYLPYKSTDHKKVRTFAEMPKTNDIGLWDSFLNMLSQYFPYLEKYSDTVVDSIVFDVKIEPETQAEVVLPTGLTDIDNRRLSSALSSFHIRIGSMTEWLNTPQKFSIYEKNLANLAMPIGVVNLHQNLFIRKSGENAKTWEPIADIPTIVQLFRAYAQQGFYRYTKEYTSPMDVLKIKNTLVKQNLTGTKNRPEVLQFPFARVSENGGTGSNEKSKAGVYAIEIASSSMEASESNDSSEENRYYLNPRGVVAQVTNLSVHLKKGEQKSLAWVTELDSAQPVAGAQLDIYNCLGEKIQSLTTNTQGLVSFENSEWAKDCNRAQFEYSSYADPKEFFVVAQRNDDLTIVHSSWHSSNDNALGAPGLDWYYSNIIENRPNFHSIIGVNLVKPGQQVPIQLVAKIPVAQGFEEVPAEFLPPVARIVNQADSDIFYEFPLVWSAGSANINWQVPNDTSVKLGSYSILLLDPKDTKQTFYASGEIEVAEFKIPLMTGVIGFSEETLVKPNSIPTNTIIRYANGVGAKNLSATFSYYFEPTSINSKDLPDFIFGSGPVKTVFSDTRETNDKLPNGNRPASIEELKTQNDGSFTVDIGKEAAPQGGTISEMIKTLDRPQKLVVRVRYQDQMGEFQTISKSKVIYNSKEYVGTHLISGARKDAKLQTAVIDVNNKRITNIDDLEFQVSSIETRVIGEELFGGLIKNTLERQLKPVQWIKNCQIENQIVSCNVGALKAGNYAYQVTSKSTQQVAHILFKIDEKGRVYGRSDFYNFGDEDQGKYLPLALNKPSYKDGEKAVVSFSSPFKTCQALVTVERNEVMESFLAADACQKGFVEIPVHASMAPNAFVSIYAVTGRVDSGETKIGEQDLGRPTYRLGFANLKVDWNHFKSKVNVTLNQDTFKPGQTVEVQAEVTPEHGALTNGSVTFVALEEKILELKANDTYQILNALMQLRGHSVATITTLEHAESSAKTIGSAPEDARKGGDEGGDGSSKSEFKRKLFNALVTFKPNVPLVNGIAKYSFKANDSLTKFRVFAIAIDSANKFGTGEATYLSSQATQTYSNIPAIAYSGDQYPITVTIQNNTAKNANYRTEVTAVIKDKNGHVIGTKTLTKTSSVAASGSEAVEAGSIEVDDNAATIEYTIRVYDENGNVVDVIEPEAQKILATVPVSIKNSYLLAMDQDTFTKTLKKPEGSLPGKGEVQVTVAKSLVDGAIQQIRTNVQQDQFSDVFIESKFNKAFLLSTAQQNSELKKVLESLIGYTDSNGLIKYYAGANAGSVFLTARILNVLATKKWAMALLPSALKEKIKGGVAKVLTKKIDPSYVGDTPIQWLRAQMAIAQAAFSLADENLTKLAVAVADSVGSELARDPKAYGLPLDQWSNSDLASLWMVQNITGKVSLKDSPIYQLLTGPGRLIYVGNSAQLKGGPSFNLYYSDETIETALLLLGHSQMKGSADLAKSLAVGLVNASAKSWYNSSTMLSVAMALDAFATNYEAEAVTGSTQITVVEESQSIKADWSQTKVAELKSNWTGENATVQLNHSGGGHPWVGIQAYAAVPLTEAMGQGLSISKHIKNLTHDSGFQTGDVIEVELVISAAGAIDHVGLQDPIPAGSNIINEAYGYYSAGEKRYSGYWFYFAHLDRGNSIVKYQYQLNNPGSFKMAPTRAQGLYSPSVFGETPNAPLTVIK